MIGASLQALIGSMSPRHWLMAALAAAALAGVTWLRWDAAQDERRKAEIEAVRQARQRIILMETNNENYRRLSPRDRCVRVMRDSGLPERHCDER